MWTPRLTTGRPLSFAPLAGLRDVADDPDEFEIALDSAVAALVPRSGLPASGARLSQGRAVLKEALAAYVRGGGGELTGFLGYLSTLPAGVSQLASGTKLAADVAQTLLAETVNDPMLGGAGEAVDPSVLLQATRGKRARVSVISLVGLPNDEQRQHFVNQLQMALFAWVKKHPAGDRPLGGLFVVDEAQTFAPSGGRTATTESTLALAPRPGSTGWAWSSPRRRRRGFTTGSRATRRRMRLSRPRPRHGTGLDAAATRTSDGSPALVTPVRAGCIQLGRHLEMLPTQFRIREQLVQTSRNVGAGTIGRIVCDRIPSHLGDLTL